MRNFKASLFAGLFSIAISQGALAQSEQDVRPTPTQIRALVQSERYDDARALLASVSNNPVDLALLEAEIAATDGRIQDAIDILRQLIAAEPNVELPRILLAQLLVQDRQYDNARFQYEILRTYTPDEERRGFYTEQIAQIDSYQPYGVSFDFSLTPSTNINGAEEDGTVTFPFTGDKFAKPDELQPQFGWRANLGVSAFARHRLADHHEIMANLNAQVSRYDYRTLDSEYARLSVQYRYQDATAAFSFGPYYQRNWGDGEQYSASYNFQTGESTANIINRDEDFTTVGFTLNASHIYNERTRFYFNYTMGHAVYDDDYYDYRENYRNQAALGMNYALDARHILGISGTSERYEEAGGQGDFQSHNSYVGYTASTSLTSSFSNQWRTELGIDYTRRNYDGLYPLYSEARWDDIYAAKVSMQNSNWQWNNLVPRLTCNFSHTVSNVDAFNVDDAECGVSLTTEF